MESDQASPMEPRFWHTQQKSFVKLKVSTLLVVGGWVGGDAWFGIVMTAVEVKKRMEVESTWIIKGNHYFYPMAGLHAVLKGRFGNTCAGHWVSMTSVIVGVKLLALSYAWSQKGVSYFLSTCGSTHKSSVMY
jgi:hypothetical protein